MKIGIQVEHEGKNDCEEVGKVLKRIAGMVGEGYESGNKKGLSWSYEFRYTEGA